MQGQTKSQLQVSQYCPLILQAGVAIDSPPRARVPQVRNSPIFSVAPARCGKPDHAVGRRRERRPSGVRDVPAAHWADWRDWGAFPTEL